jgi:hypothetical protein
VENTGTDKNNWTKVHTRGNRRTDKNNWTVFSSCMYLYSIVFICACVFLLYVPLFNCFHQCMCFLLVCTFVQLFLSRYIQEENTRTDKNNWTKVHIRGNRRTDRNNWTKVQTRRKYTHR